jgi:hypothetical protein
LRGERVVAGPTSSAVIDRQGMFWLAGKWKISGDGKSADRSLDFPALNSFVFAI